MALGRGRPSVQCMSVSIEIKVKVKNTIHTATFGNIFQRSELTLLAHISGTVLL